MNATKHRLVWLAVVGVASTGCFRYSELPPAPPPAETIPVVDEAPPPTPEGMVPVTFDLAVGHATVQEVATTGTSSTVTVATSSGRGRDTNEHEGYAAVDVHSTDLEVAHTVCITPCVANFSPGPHTIRLLPLADLGPDAVEDHVGFQVGARPLVVRAELRQDVAPSKFVPTMLYTIAGTFLMAGGLFLAGAPDRPPLLIAGGVSLGAGVVSAVVGLIVDAATIGHRRQGASTYWEPKGPSFTVK